MLRGQNSFRSFPLPFFGHHPPPPKKSLRTPILLNTHYYAQCSNALSMSWKKGGFKVYRFISVKTFPFEILNMHQSIYIIYIYKVVISVFVCLFVCPIITEEPLNRFDSNFNWRTRENHWNVLPRF